MAGASTTYRPASKDNGLGARRGNYGSPGIRAAHSEWHRPLRHVVYKKVTRSSEKRLHVVTSHDAFGSGQRDTQPATVKAEYEVGPKLTQRADKGKP